MWSAESIIFQENSGYTEAYLGDGLLWEKPKRPEVWVTFSAASRQYVSKPNGSSMLYSYDTKNWSAMTDPIMFGTIGKEIVYVAGKNIDGIGGKPFSFSSSTVMVAVGGNAMALLDYSNTGTTLPSGAFMYLFSGCSAIISVSSNLLPATTLKYGCYMGMFYGCTSLTTAPALPATTLADRCYMSMFRGCTSLVNAPALPVTSLAVYCYYAMFYGCTSLVNAPALPAETLAYGCYMEMFRGCASLVNAPALPATTLDDKCYMSMFRGCTSLETAPELPATTLANNCYVCMFWGCTSLVNAPVICATTLASNCCAYMFYECTSLVNAPELPATTLANSCYNSMFWGCTSLTKAPELPATTLADGCYGNMFYGCSKLNEIHTSAKTITADSCTENWVDSVSGSGDFYCYSTAGWVEDSNSGIPIGWTKHYIDTPTPSITSITLTAPTWKTDIAASGGTANSGNCNTDYVVIAYYSDGTTADVTFSVTYLDGSSIVASSTVTSRHSCGNLTLTATYSGFTYSANVVMYQAAYVPSITSISFSGLSWNASKDIPASGGTATKDNCTYYVIAHYDVGSDVDITSAATISGSLVIPSSTTTTRHTAGTLTLTATYDSFSDTGSVDAYQAGYVEPVSGETWVSFTAGATQTLRKPSDTTMEYSYDKTNWSSLTAVTLFGTSGKETIYVRGKNTSGTGGSPFTFGNTTSMVGVGGNVMALLDWENTGMTMPSFAFAYLFSGCSAIISVSSNLLPATTLADRCYLSMFRGCASLVTAPELPATTLEFGCYFSMFYGCTSLVNAPALPATTLVDSCYMRMFEGCTSLVNPPIISATSLYAMCCCNMFQNCTSLVSAPELPVTTLARQCYESMFYGCTSLETAPELPATDLSLANCCYDSMFRGCTSLVNAPALPATTLAYGCYEYMFYGCTSLVNAPALPATDLSLANYCYESMFYGCTSLVNAPALPATTLVDGCYADMFYGCTSLVNAPALPATTLADNCYFSMFYGCTSLVNAPALPATTLVDRCYMRMFRGCTSLVNAPALPATNPESNCYVNMFYGCTSLSSITCSLYSVGDSVTTNWVYNVASTGEFHCYNFVTWETGVNGIPSGWTRIDIPI